jgi:pimeloyl-ACP methyl ester carboxylesterase
MLPLFKDKLRTAAREFTKQGIDLSAYNPAEVADDIESVRLALGAKRVNLWGVCYGTYLALAMIRRHEESVNRAVLTGVVGPDQANLRRPATLQEQLKQVDRLLKEDENASKAVPDLLGSLRALLDQLEKEPAAVELTDPHTKKTVRVVVGKWDLQFFLSNRIGRTYSLKGLPGFCAPLFRGDLRPLAREALAFRRGTVGSLMGWQMLSSSGTSMERVRLVEREAPGTLLGDAVNFPFPAVAAALTIQDFGPVFRARFRTAVPVLFISGTLDLDIANVSAIQDSFADHAHLIVEGASHGYDLFYFAPGLKDRMLEFLSARPLSALRINLLPFRFNRVEAGRE